MKKKYKIKKYGLIYLLLILLVILIIQTNFINIFTNFLNKVFIKNNNFVIEDMAYKYIKELEEENNKLKELNNINKDEYTYVNATVIYRNPSFWYDAFTINKGKKDNIKEGDMVINNYGLIGTVEKVLENTSEISLITNINKNKKITVAISNDVNKIYGIISNYDKIKNELLVSELTSDIESESDLTVLTTNFTNTFKEGIIIGYVKEIKDDKNVLSKNAIVKPIVNYNDIKYVCIIGMK